MNFFLSPSFYGACGLRGRQTKSHKGMYNYRPMAIPQGRGTWHGSFATLAQAMESLGDYVTGPAMPGLPQGSL